MNERWLGVPLPIWILVLAGGVYFMAARAKAQGGSLLSIAPTESFTTPPNVYASQSGGSPGTNPQPGGAAPGTSPSLSATGSPYDPTAIQPAAMPTVLGAGVSGGRLAGW